MRLLLSPWARLALGLAIAVAIVTKCAAGGRWGFKWELEALPGVASATVVDRGELFGSFYVATVTPVHGESLTFWGIDRSWIHDSDLIRLSQIGSWSVLRVSGRSSVALTVDLDGGPDSPLPGTPHPVSPGCVG